MKVRNVKVSFRDSSLNDKTGIYTQDFYDWFDVADWLKQKNLSGAEITIVAWRYEEKQL